jgi:hypothetical protein
MRALALMLATALSAAAAVSLTSLTVAGPNSATAVWTSSGNLSLRITCGTNGIAFPILTPWVDILIGSVGGTWAVAQLQPATTYQCRAEAATLANGAGSVTTTAPASVTTSASLVTKALVVKMGATQGYNQNFPLSGRWTDGDTTYCATMQNGITVCQSNDGKGPQDILSTGGPYTLGRATFLWTLDNAFSSIALLNPMGTGDGSNGAGGIGTFGHPTCAGEYAGSVARGAGLYAIGNRLWWAIHRDDSGPSDSSILTSEDGGATWYHPAHASGQASANGDWPCRASGVIWGGATLMGQPKFLQVGAAGVVTNPIDGIDAYIYLQARDHANTVITLARCYREVFAQSVGSCVWDYFKGGIGGDPNTQANWDTTLGNSTPIMTLGWVPGTFSDIDVRYLGRYGRYLATGEEFLGANDTRSVFLDAPRITGPYALILREPTRPPFDSFLNQYLERAWPSFFMPSYNASPVGDSVQMLHSGTFTQQSSNHAHDHYSPWLVLITINSTPAHTGGPVHSGRVTR